jgi:uncharacterized metal-binding protein YceD (DUF177 family)
VDYLKDYVIPFVGLSTGDHQYEYLIDDKFFANFEYSEIKRAQVNVRLSLNKHERMLVLTFSMKGTIEVSCSRCLDNFDLPIEDEQVQYIKFGPEYKEEDADVLIIPESETHVNVAPFIYDYLNLLVPFRIVHPVNEDGLSGCDPDVIRRLEKEIKQKESDPRWDKLKGLNIDNN